MAPTDAVTGPRRQYWRPPKAISGGSQASKYSRSRHTLRHPDLATQNRRHALADDTPSSALSGPLRALKTGEFGKILKDVDREVSGVRIHNLTTFTDPMMKSFVRFMNNLGDTELSPAVPERQFDDSLE